MVTIFPFLYIFCFKTDEQFYHIFFKINKLIDQLKFNGSQTFTAKIQLIKDL